MKYFIANWKANKNFQETRQWVSSFLEEINKDSDFQKRLLDKQFEIIICPPFPFLTYIKEKINKFAGISLGAQDISVHESGTYTGEVTAKTLQGLVDYAIIGHSERRTHFKEDENIINNKITLTIKYNIKPIYCFQNQDNYCDNPAKFVAYEPPWAISKGFEDSMKTKIEETPENVVKVKEILNIRPDKCFIYGGSVNPFNIKEYLKYQQIDGFIVGGASLDSQQFFRILKDN